MKNLTVEIELYQKSTQVTYEYTLKGEMGEDDRFKVGFCHPTAADAYECVQMGYSYTITEDSFVTNYIFESATGVTKSNAESENYWQDVITKADDAKHCGGGTIKATLIDGAFEHTTPEKADNLCDELSMDAAKQAKDGATFTI